MGPPEPSTPMPRNAATRSAHCRREEFSLSRPSFSFLQGERYQPLYFQENIYATRYRPGRPSTTHSLAAWGQNEVGRHQPPARSPPPRVDHSFLCLCFLAVSPGVAYLRENKKGIWEEAPQRDFVCVCRSLIRHKKLGHFTNSLATCASRRQGSATSVVPSATSVAQPAGCAGFQPGSRAPATNSTRTAKNPVLARRSHA